MKRIKFIALLTIVLNACSSGQISNTELSEEYQFVHDNFVEGKYNAELMTGSENNERRIALTNKMQLAIKDNYSWYVDFVKDAPNGLPIMYDQKLGLTKAEFVEFRSIIDNYKMASELNFNLTIQKENSTIMFTSDYQPELLKNLEIDLSSQQISLGSYKFELTDTFDVTNENNRMGSKWKGYQWTFQEPSKIDFSNVAELRGKDAILYRITLGILEPSKNLYLSIKGVEIQDGVQKVNFTVPIFMNSIQ